MPDGLKGLILYRLVSGGLVEDPFSTWPSRSHLSCKTPLSRRPLRFYYTGRSRCRYLPPAMTGSFSQVESSAPVLQEPIWQQDRDLDASSVEARIKLAYERARSLINAVGQKKKTSTMLLRDDQH